jgi:hypothetical protein
MVIVAKQPSVPTALQYHPVQKIWLCPLNGGWAFLNTIDYSIPAAVS